MGCVQIKPLHVSPKRQDSDSSSNSQSTKSINSADSIDNIQNEMSPSHSNLRSPYSIFSPTSRRQNVSELERSFRDDRQQRLSNKSNKSTTKNKSKYSKPLQLNNRVLSHSIDEEQEMQMNGGSICDDDGKGLILNLPSSMIFDEELRELNGNQDKDDQEMNYYRHGRTISRTLECGLEHVLKEQNDLLRQLSVDHEAKLKSRDNKDNVAYINRNYYYEDYRDSEQDLEQYID